MKTKKIIATIESSKDGFGVYAEALPGITGFGDTIEAAKADFESALSEVLEQYKIRKQVTPEEFNNGNLDFIYK